MSRTSLQTIEPPSASSVEKTEELSNCEILSSFDKVTLSADFLVTSFEVHVGWKHFLLQVRETINRDPFNDLVWCTFAYTNFLDDFSENHSAIYSFLEKTDFDSRRRL